MLGEEELGSGSRFRLPAEFAKSDDTRRLSLLGKRAQSSFRSPRIQQGEGSLLLARRQRGMNFAQKACVFAEPTIGTPRARERCRRATVRRRPKTRDTLLFVGGCRWLPEVNGESLGCSPWSREHRGRRRPERSLGRSERCVTRNSYRSSTLVARLEGVKGAHATKQKGRADEQR